MMSAAVRSSVLVCLMRDCSTACGSAPSPATSGITATPVSNPDMPSASFGKYQSEKASTMNGFDCWCTMFRPHSVIATGSVHMATSSYPMTTTFSARYAATSMTAIQIASRNPLRKIAPSSATSTSVRASWWCIQGGTNGFSTTCCVASAAESVMVMTKSVAANPSRHRTNALPRQRGRRSSSTDRLPWPCGLSDAMRP